VKTRAMEDGGTPGEVHDRNAEREERRRERLEQLRERRRELRKPQ
jgi:hypothetical protein